MTELQPIAYVYHAMPYPRRYSSISPLRHIFADASSPVSLLKGREDLHVVFTKICPHFLRGPRWRLLSSGPLKRSRIGKKTIPVPVLKRLSINQSIYLSSLLQTKLVLSKSVIMMMLMMMMIIIIIIIIINK